MIYIKTVLFFMENMDVTIETDSAANTNNLALSSSSLHASRTTGSSAEGVDKNAKNVIASCACATNDDRDRWVPAPKIITDQVLWGPAWNAVYIAFLGVLNKDSSAVIWEAITSTALPLVIAGIRLWPLAHVVTYGL